MNEPNHRVPVRGGRIAGWELGRRLRVLTGVDETLLAEVPYERTRYTALGGVVLGTATIAAFSMLMGLLETLGQGSILLIFPVLLWGLFVLNLDRWLVASATGTQWSRRLALLLPRLLLAVFFGVIIAEPLVLRVFQTAIEQHIEQQRQDDLGAYRTGLVACNPVPGQDKPTVDPASPYCRSYRLDIGADPASAGQTLADDQQQATRLQSTITTETNQLDALNTAAANECSGAKGPGLTGQVGYGRQCLDRQAAATQYAQTHPIAQQQAQLTALQGTIDQLSPQVGNAQSSYQTQLTSAINAKVAERRSQQGAIGLLERFQALSQLISDNGFLFAARWAISIFFILVDCLPVLGKLIGGITAYDRLVDRASTSAVRVFDETSRQREDDLINQVEGKRYRSQARMRKERAEADLDLLRHKNDMERQMDEQTTELTDQLLRQARTKINGHSADPDHPTQPFLLRR